MAMKNIIKAIIVSMAFVACDSGEERYSREYLCQFTFDMSMHSTSALTRCIDNPSMFVRVDVKKENGIFALYIYPNSGNDNERILLRTDPEIYKMGQVGANNSIIVGCSNFNGLKAYDSQCPNCLEAYTGISYPLAWTDNGQAVSCAKCKRKYQLNSDGITDNGLRMLEYRLRVELDYWGNKKCLYITN